MLRSRCKSAFHRGWKSGTLLVQPQYLTWFLAPGGALTTTMKRTSVIRLWFLAFLLADPLFCSFSRGPAAGLAAQTVQPPDNHAPNPAAEDESGTNLSAGQKALLEQAVRLTEEGKYVPAMTIYRQVFRMHPPPGEWSIAYYETEAATGTGRPAAIEGLRALATKYPLDSRYPIALGRVLIYDPATREEGRNNLAKYPTDPKAEQAYRQSLLWDAANPAVAGQIRTYLATHNDPQLAAIVKATQPQPAAGQSAPATSAPVAAAPSSGGRVAPAVTPPPAAAPSTPVATPTNVAKVPQPEPAADHAAQPPTIAAKEPPKMQVAAASDAPSPHSASPAPAPESGTTRSRGADIVAAYQALNANRIQEAETRFKAVLNSDPNNPKALAGMGYVRMQQGNFLGAISYLEQAKRGDPQNKGLLAALDTARFWFIMGEGQNALSSNDLTTAEKRYREALDLRPNSGEALEGLGGTLLKAQQPAPAVPLFQRAVTVSPDLADAWRGLFLAQVQQGSVADALATVKRVPSAAMAQLSRDPLFLQSLASAYAAAGRGAEAEATLQSALKLSFPPEQASLKSHLQMQLAGMLSAENHLDEAATLYQQVVAADATNVTAWQGLVRVQHALGHDQAALQTIQEMSPATYSSALHDPAFEIVVASVYENENKLDTAQDLLQKAITEQTSAGQKPSPALQMQLADIYTKRGNPQLAYPVYQQVIRESPDRADAWAGLLSALHVTGHDAEAVEQLKLIPAAVRTQLEANPGYLQTMAHVYASVGRSREASAFLGRVEQDYAAQRASVPAATEIEDAWLLLNGQEDAKLYAELMRLGDRTDLTAEQRRTVQTIWTNWAARRANQAAAMGNTRRAVAILDAAARAFPDNPAAIRSLAIGYAQDGEPHQAVLIYRSQNMTHATAADYEAAVSAALADGDNKDAEAWLRYALATYPSDPQVLILAARFEQARGDTAKAIKYYRASLKAMPPQAPGSKLAADLGLPAPSTPMTLPSPEQPLALSVLLAPGNSDSGPAATPASQPFLPHYESQPPLPPYDGSGGLVPPYMSNPDADGSASLRSPSGQAEVASTVRDAATTALAPTSSRSVASQTGAGQTSGTAQAASADEIYKPYVPYVPPAASSRDATAQRNSSPSPVVVQLGDNSPHLVRQQTDMTDVLPTQHYAQSARANQAAASHAEVAAARADRIRRLQEDSTARTGQSHPPPEDTITATPQNADYLSGGQGGPQVAQPAKPVRQIGNIPDTGAQQYPQPRTQPGTSAPAIRRVRPISKPSVPSVTAAATPAPVPPPAAPAQVTPPAATAVAPAALPPAVSAPPVAQPYPLPAPPTDAELRARSLPPLGGFFEAQAPIALTPRQQAENELASLEGAYSGWAGVTGIGRFRSGRPGLDRLYDIEAPVEASAVLARTLRLTAVAVPVSLSSGVFNASSSSTANVPYLGTLAANSAAVPAEQYSTGLGGELQLTTKEAGVAVGYTPVQFLLHNVTGRFWWSTLGQHLSLYADRQPVKDTQLSYAGLYDPGAASANGQHPVWGAVVATTGGIRLDFRSGTSSYSLTGDGGILTGTHVQENTRFGGTASALFRLGYWPNHGLLSLGAAMAGMHYERDEVGLSYGQGGYFSPDSYFVASVPMSFIGHSGANFHYSVFGSLGLEAFQQAEAPFYPLDPVLQQNFVPSNGANCTGATAPSYNCGEYPVTDTTAFSYAVRGEASYRFDDHWYGGLLFSANNSYNYNNVSAGFFFRFVFRGEHSTQGYPAGLFRTDGLRPLQIP